MQCKSQAFIWLLVFEFWLSGLFVLSVIFLHVDDLDTLTLWTFLAYSLGSFSGGILSDIVGRRIIFIISSAILLFSSLLAIVNFQIGFIIANLCIGPLNNLTFVFLNETKNQNCEINTVKVLIGWAFSQITLGLFFLYINDTDIFLWSLVGLSFLFTIGAIILTTQTSEFIDKRQELRSRTIKQILIPNNIKIIIGGSILMFMMQMFYYRTQFTLDRFGVSLQINTIIVGFTQTLANLLFFQLVRHCRRKLLLQLLLIALMIFLLLLILIGSPIFQTTIQGIMRLCDTSIMLVLGVYLPELFEMKDRGKGINYIMCFGVFGSALSGKVFSHLPFGYLQIFLFAALFALFLMPETKKKENFSPSLLQRSYLQDQTN